MAQKLLNLIGIGNDSLENDNSSAHNQQQCEPIENSEQYCQFRSQIALKRLALDDNDSNKIWSIYECGSKEIQCPVIFFPPVSGSADIFFMQLKYLSDRGHRVISAEYPNYCLLEEFNNGFHRFMKHFGLRKVHIFGASLGGFLAQKFAEEHPSLVASLILCNTFADTSRFKFVNTVPLVWINPAPVLRKIFITQLVPETTDEAIRNAGEFMNTKLNSLTHEQLISRLNLNLTDDYVRPDNLQTIPITIIDVFDECANSQITREELYKMYPNARLAHLKSGGNFPYLSRPEEVNIHLLVHLRQFHNTDDSSTIHYLDKIETTNDNGDEPELVDHNYEQENQL